MKTLSLAIGLLGLGLAACGYNDESYNEGTAYSNEDVSYDESGNYPADGNAAAGNYADNTASGNAASNTPEPASETNATTTTSNGY